MTEGRVRRSNAGTNPLYAYVLFTRAPLLPPVSPRKRLRYHPRFRSYCPFYLIRLPIDLPLGKQHNREIERASPEPAPSLSFPLFPGPVSSTNQGRPTRLPLGVRIHSPRPPNKDGPASSSLLPENIQHLWRFKSSWNNAMSILRFRLQFLTSRARFCQNTSWI